MVRSTTPTLCVLLIVSCGRFGGGAFGQQNRGAEAQAYWEDRPPQVGDEAPPLTFDRYFGDPSLPPPGAFAWSDLAGTVVVLEFSATWCAPCLAAIPHMTDLIGAFDGRPVAFLSLSNEKEDQAERLATVHGYAGALGWDADGSTFEDYWVNGIPRVAVIGPDGRIAALTHPNHLTVEAIEAALRGEAIALPDSHPNPTRRNWNDNAVRAGVADDTTTRTIVGSASVPSGIMRADRKTGVIRSTGAAIRSALTIALDVHHDDLILEADLPEDDYLNIDIVPIDGRIETSRAILLERVCGMYGLTVERETRTMSGRALRRVEGAPPPPPGKGPGGLSYRGGMLELGNGDMAELTRGLRFAARVPVVDETGLDGIYAISIEWDHADALAGMNAALQAVGLELVDAECPVEVAIIRADR